MSTVLYIEPVSGIAGDMTAAALTGLAGGGVPDKVMTSLKSLPLDETWSVNFRNTDRNGISAGRFIVEIDHSTNHPHRTLKDIESVLRGASFPRKALDNALRVFRKLAEAEACVHGVKTDSVHFHEVGAVDALIDVSAVCLLLDYLEVDSILASPPALGRGTVHTAHGLLPVPVPATLKLLEGLPVRHTKLESELTTPTGAALLRALAEFPDEPPAGRLLASAYGAGSRKHRDLPNVLRASILKVDGTPETDTVGVVECNLDDFPGESLTTLGPAILELGAMDYALLPFTGKKGRPGFMVQVICRPADMKSIASLLLSETSTLGVRLREDKRFCMPRKGRKISTPWGDVKIKVAFDEDGNIIKWKPEHDSCAELAGKNGTEYMSFYRKITAYISRELENELDR